MTSKPWCARWRHAEHIAPEVNPPKDRPVNDTTLPMVGLRHKLPSFLLALPSFLLAEPPLPSFLSKKRGLIFALGRHGAHQVFAVVCRINQKQALVRV